MLVPAAPVGPGTNHHASSLSSSTTRTAQPFIEIDHQNTQYQLISQISSRNEHLHLGKEEL
jgi:hypothetical protein